MPESPGQRARTSGRPAIGREDLRRVYRTGRRHTTAVATVHLLPHTQPRLRVAVPVSRRIGSAVTRNRVRRRLREAFRELQREIRGGWDIVIVARPAAVVADFRSIVEDLRGALRQGAAIVASCGPV